MNRTVSLAIFMIAGSFLLASSDAFAQRKGSSSNSVDEQASALAEAYSVRENAAKAAAPWTFKTDSLYRFSAPDRAAPDATLRHASTAFDWVYVSPVMNEGKGFYPDFALHLGVTREGRIQGVIYADVLSRTNVAAVAAEKFGELGSFSVFAEGGESTLVPLSDQAVAQVPEITGTGTQELHFRTFDMPPKGYRMLSALPDENRMQFLFRKADSSVESFRYALGGHSNPWVFSLGYAKELSRLATQASGN